MSDYLHSLDAADSGFLNAFLGPHQQHAQRGVPSRVGEKPLASSSEGDLNQRLRQVPTPDGLEQRLHGLIDSL